MDKDVEVKEPSSAEERAEANSLRLGAALLRLRGKGHGDAADLLEGLHDAFTRRRSAYLRASPSRSERAARIPRPTPTDTIATDPSARAASSSTTATTTEPPPRTTPRPRSSSTRPSCRCSSSWPGPAGPAEPPTRRGAPSRIWRRHSRRRIARRRRRRRRTPSALDEPDVRTAAAARAARAGDWLELAPASELEATPSLSFASARPSASLGRLHEPSRRGANDSAFDLAEMSRALEATPGVGALSFGGGAGAGFADPFSFASRADRSLFGAGSGGGGGGARRSSSRRGARAACWTRRTSRGRRRRRRRRRTLEARSMPTWAWVLTWVLTWMSRGWATRTTTRTARGSRRLRTASPGRGGSRVGSPCPRPGPRAARS